MTYSETIFAPATSVGTGAISIIRVSGPESTEIADRLITFRHGEAASSTGYSLKYGSILEESGTLDEVVAAIYRAPQSYTGEDMVEIMCHSSQYVVARLLELLGRAGARPAMPGEFTRRAFVNGKMDLSQAEAVADLIASTSESAHRLAMNQLKGNYSAKLSDIRGKLIEIASLMELELDFSDEDIEFADRDRLATLLDEAVSHIDGLCASFRDGNAIKNGVPVVIAGNVNTGKSTLLNALVGDSRAIVSDIPGTTRDTVEDTMIIDGILYRFIDTAGIRETSDKVEKMGISRTLDRISEADVIILVLDALAPLKELEKSVSSILPRLSTGQELICVRNKVDLFDAIHPEEFPVKDRSYNIFDLKYPAFGTYDIGTEDLARKLCLASDGKFPAAAVSGGIIDISALTGEGIDKLLDRLSEGRRGRFTSEEILVTNARHANALRRASESIARVRDALSGHVPTDLLSQDLREALREIGSITGEITDEEVLGEIFGRFCIGK